MSSKCPEGCSVCTSASECSSCAEGFSFDESNSCVESKNMNIVWILVGSLAGVLLIGGLIVLIVVKSIHPASVSAQPDLSHNPTHEVEISVNAEHINPV